MPLFRRRPPEWDATTPDHELVTRAQRGEREAFAALYDRYLPRVHGYGYRLLGEREAAEDATTEVFMRALAALPAYRAGSFRSWLFAIAHNMMADELAGRLFVTDTENNQIVLFDASGQVIATWTGDAAGARVAIAVGACSADWAMCTSTTSATTMW